MEDIKNLKEAMMYKELTDKIVQCNLCHRHCVLKDGETGECHVRKNINGKLYSLVYGKTVAWNIDPIEKKPFYNFMPGSKAFSFSTVGCNFHCKNCQNWTISQPERIEGEILPPKKIIELAEQNNTQGIAYTYTEPTIFFEYAYDTAKLAYQKGLYNIFVTNGYMTPETIDKMNYIDASRIDIKSMSDKFYHEICGGVNLEFVLDSIKRLYRKQHIEIIALLIPSLNDSDDEIRQMAQWIKNNTDKDVPLHFIAYYPAYKMTLPPTPLSTLRRARKIAMDEGLNYVYTGNIPGDAGENTYCPNCGNMIIQRYGFQVIRMNITEDNRCPVCGHRINIITNLDEYRKRKRD
ncbi:AmmeMemoRadiSam system radical SAM enzyme [Candidatus Micrarchaeota archaeon]|nr:AmmeMemoRadiSam system radical SAM enzyme [Candidatus Micrarchaeota archaeon]